MFAAFALLLVGSYELFNIHYKNDLEQKASDALKGGNYLASLSHYATLKEKEVLPPLEADSKIEESKNLLVAEAMLARAKQSKDDGEWFAVKALLEEGDATTNTSFTHYEEAVALYVEAANKVRKLEEKIEAELAKFRQDAAEEKALRKSAEEQAVEAKEEVTQVKQTLKTTIKEKEQTTAELQAATFARNAAVEDAIRARFEKFLNELELYVNMLARANNHLDDAIVEIERGKGSFALVSLGSGKDLFDGAGVSIEDMLQNRTEEQYKGEVRVLLQSTALFIEATRSLANAIFYIGRTNETEEEEFARFFNQGKTAKAEAMRLMNLTKDFTASSR